MSDNLPPFYLSGDVIYKRPITHKIEGGERITVGFPVCTVSEFVDAQEVLQLFNEHAA
jgi:hypothetical protein